MSLSTPVQWNTGNEGPLTPVTGCLGCRCCYDNSALQIRDTVDEVSGLL